MNHLFTIVFFRVGHIIRVGDGEDGRGRENFILNNLCTYSQNRLFVDGECMRDFLNKACGGDHKNFDMVTRLVAWLDERDYLGAVPDE